MIICRDIFNGLRVQLHMSINNSSFKHSCKWFRSLTTSFLLKVDEREAINNLLLHYLQVSCCLDSLEATSDMLLLICNIEMYISMIMKP